MNTGIVLNSPTTYRLFFDFWVGHNFSFGPDQTADGYIPPGARIREIPLFLIYPQRCDLNIVLIYASLFLKATFIFIYSCGSQVLMITIEGSNTIP
ncbi:hypothetical protein LZF95_12910 [Algoriphagus sp. AGSA1]|uniref:hypothetical protein n=1 Tax=Algoriphagus sp. AGSA1 TaxID=2907213 RepID=UPI001F27C892|nr:hypothetical protein [Algoriphagus sp. AGSA1]MCE7055581.1 hypothetical protein [Algoriphagus sp. AGSA1]